MSTTTKTALTTSSRPTTSAAAPSPAPTSTQDAEEQAAGAQAAPTGSPAAPLTGTRGLLEVHGVHKSYGTLEVLHDVDLTVQPGEVTVILGPSGSGKSTLLRVVNHLEKVDSGFVALDGDLIGYSRSGDTLRELKEKAILAQRTQIGFVFQSFNLFPHLTVLENVVEAPVSAQGRKRSEVEVEARELLARVGLADKADARPRQLSGGQQQRVAIARALATRPRLLLFDEPTSALDPELVGEVLDVIKALAHDGTTLVVVTHEIGFAREVADTVVFMDSGRIVEQGPAAQVIDDPQHPRTQAFLDKVL